MKRVCSNCNVCGEDNAGGYCGCGLCARVKHRRRRRRKYGPGVEGQTGMKWGCRTEERNGVGKMKSKLSNSMGLLWGVAGWLTSGASNETTPVQIYIERGKQELGKM